MYDLIDLELGDSASYPHIFNRLCVTILMLLFDHRHCSCTCPSAVCPQAGLPSRNQYPSGAGREAQQAVVLSVKCCSSSDPWIKLRYDISD